jgi:hypothetical protein
LFSGDSRNGLTRGYQAGGSAHRFSQLYNPNSLKNCKISEDMIYGTTCFVWNRDRIFSEKYFPISPECIRSV